MLWWTLWRLKRQLESDSPFFMRALSAEKLGDLGNKKAVEPLIVALKDYDHNVRREAAKALGRIGDARAIEPLIGTLKDSDRDVCKEAAKALEALKYEPADKKQRAIMFVVSEKWDKVVGLGTDALEPLIASLKGSNIMLMTPFAETVRRTVGELVALFSSRAAGPLITAFRSASNDSNIAGKIIAAEALKKVKGEHAVEQLITALKDSNKEVRKMAVELLGQAGSTRAVEPLIEVLKDDDKQMRRQAIWSLGLIGDARAVEPIIAALKDSDKSVREAAADTFWHWNEEVRAVEPLINALKDDDMEVRRSAALALGRVKDRRAAQPLATLIRESTDKRVRGAAVEALTSIGDIDALIRAVKDARDWVLNLEAARKMIEVGEDDRAFKLLRPLTKHRLEYVQEEAYRSLRRVGTPEAKQVVEVHEREIKEERSAEQAEKDRQVENVRSRVSGMSDQEMVSALRKLCNAYEVDDRGAIAELEPLATAIGERLNDRGGITEMRRVFHQLEGIRGARTVEMHWGGIGDWRA
jgi:HEAT repeat protein